MMLLVANNDCFPSGSKRLLGEENYASLETTGRQLKKKKKKNGGDCVGTCCVCDGDKPNTLTLMYDSAGKTSPLQTGDKASCKGGQYPDETDITVWDKDNNVKLATFTGVKDGSILVINATSGEDKFDSETNFLFSESVNGNPNPCYIHTSVSLVVSKRMRMFLVMCVCVCVLLT